jgi:hypothetical protein
MLVIKGTTKFAAACHDIGCRSPAYGNCKGGARIYCSAHGGC